MVTDSAAALSGQRLPVFTKETARNAELADLQQVENRRIWDKFIDGKLVEWGKDPSALEDDDFVPPSLEIIALACRTAMEMRDKDFAPPTRVVPDGDGGISFERVEGDYSESLDIHPDQTVEVLRFEDCRLSARQRLA